VSKRTFHPGRGDLVELNFYPAVGREIDKRRPAIVVNPREYSVRTGLCIAVPVSTDLTPGPWWIPMPAGYLPRPSLILCDYVKNFDYRERSVALVARLPDELIDEVVSQILNLIDPMA
jgi:mRNA interferase MazF